MILNKKLKIPIYDLKLNIIVCNCLTEINDNFEEEHQVTENEYEAIVFKKKNDKGIEEFYVAFEGIPKNKIINHEVVHLVNQMFENLGIFLDRNNDEAQAYFSAYLFDQISKKLKKMKNEKQD